MISNETEEYLPFKRVDQGNWDATEQVNAVIRHTETDDVTQTNLLWQQPFGLQYKLERRKEKEEWNIRKERERLRNWMLNIEWKKKKNKSGYWRMKVEGDHKEDES